MKSQVARRMADQKRVDAEVLRRHGYPEKAELLERHAAEISALPRQFLDEQLTVPEAVEWSGYSADYIRELVREGVIPDLRPPGSQAAIRIRRGDLPRKPVTKRRDEHGGDTSMSKTERIDQVIADKTP